MFTNKNLLKLIIPLIIEQLLTSLMGTADTLMVSRVGQTAISGVSIVDSVNVLIIYLLTALATGGAVICAQYIGQKNKTYALKTAGQVILITMLLSAIIMAVFLILNRHLLELIFGTVEPEVMENAITYFTLTIISYPFLAYYNAESALFRAAGNSKLPMDISVISNLMNIAGNAVTIFGLGWGVFGAALSTLISRIYSAIAMYKEQLSPDSEFRIPNILALRPDKKIIKKVLSIGIPSAFDNSMFQLGKLVVQSTVSTLGTMAIASNALVAILETFTSAPGVAIGLGLITVSGQCIGAGKPAEAKYYIKKLTLWCFITILGISWLFMAITPITCTLAGMDKAAGDLTISVMWVITLVKPFLWPVAFAPVNGMRAAGDVTYNVIVTTVSMWIFRVALTFVLCRFMGIGLIGIWCGYFADWAVRSLLFLLRFKSEKWHQFKVI